MALWIIELNDTAVRVTRDGELVDSSPGIAVISRKQIVTGVDAAAQQHLNPRAVNNRFWQQLSESPLPGATRQCRHNADFAYHHLAAIIERCGQPNAVVIAVPAHYGESELALLLGICRALKLEVAGLVDSNVAALAGSAARGRYTVAEIYQHHATLVEVEIDDMVVRRNVQVIDQTGLARIQQACIDLIADAFLDQSRFDPLHEAVTEQLLYSNLAGWLAALNERSEIDIAIDYHGTQFAARVASREIERVTAMVLAPTRERLDPNSSLVLSAPLAGLPGVRALMACDQILATDACARGITEHRDALHNDNDSVLFTTQLPACVDANLGPVKATSATVAESGTPSHILSGHHAVALRSEWLYLGDDGALDGGAGEHAAALVALEADYAVLRSNGHDVRLNGLRIDAPQRLLAGDTIVVEPGKASFIAISVSNNSAT
jgi:hypothetical protein